MEFNLLLADQIGAHLKSLRKLRGLSQAQLGQRLGVGQARVAAIEADPGAVSVEQLLRVFQVLGVDLVARVKSGRGNTPSKPAPVIAAPKTARPKVTPAPKTAPKTIPAKVAPTKSVSKPTPVKLPQTPAKPAPKSASTKVVPPSATTLKTAAPLVIKKNKGQW